MTQKLILVRHRQVGADILTFIITHGSYFQIPYRKYRKKRQWIKAEDYRITAKAPIFAEGTLWIEDANGAFVGVFNSVNDYLSELKRFYGQTKIAVKKIYVISK